MPKFVVWYCKISEEKEIGISVGFPFYGGVADTQEEADLMARNLVNDKSRHATIIPQTFKKEDNQTLQDTMNLARKRFKLMAEDVQACERLYYKRK